MVSDEGLVSEVRSGDRRRALVALRDRLAVEVERVAEDGFCPACKRGSSSVAPLAKQLRDVVEELDRLPVAEGESVVDDLDARRAARRAAAAGS
jgi:hypothetical protein